MEINLPTEVSDRVGPKAKARRLMKPKWGSYQDPKFIHADRDGSRRISLFSRTEFTGGMERDPHVVVPFYFYNLSFDRAEALPLYLSLLEIRAIRVSANLNALSCNVALIQSCDFFSINFTFPKSYTYRCNSLNVSCN